jgi:arylsulfatase A
MLYRISEDPSELKEVSQDYPDVFLRMKDLLQEQYTDLLDDSHIWSR